MNAVFNALNEDKQSKLMMDFTFFFQQLDPLDETRCQCIKTVSFLTDATTNITLMCVSGKQFHRSAILKDQEPMLK